MTPFRLIVENGIYMKRPLGIVIPVFESTEKKVMKIGEVKIYETGGLKYSLIRRIRQKHPE